MIVLMKTRTAVNLPPKPTDAVESAPGFSRRRLGGCDMPCNCVYCPVCGGSGSVWFSFGGKFLGNRRSDDLDTIESCEFCDNGVVEFCGECLDAMSEDEY